MPHGVGRVKVSVWIPRSARKIPPDAAENRQCAVVADAAVTPGAAATGMLCGAEAGVM